MLNELIQDRKSNNQFKALLQYHVASRQDNDVLVGAKDSVQLARQDQTQIQRQSCANGICAVTWHPTKVV